MTLNELIKIRDEFGSLSVKDDGDDLWSIWTDSGCVCDLACAKYGMALAEFPKLVSIAELAAALLSEVKDDQSHLVVAQLLFDKLKELDQG